MSENFNVEERNYFVNGGKININMLDNISNGTANSLNNINKLLYTSGVLFLPTTISRNFVIEEDTNTGADITINVGFIGNAADAAYGGVAIDNDGRFIVISKNEYYIGCTEEYLSYDMSTLSWKGVVRTTDPNLALTDGAGPTGKYYRNSGNFHIPLHINVSDPDAVNKNSVYIKYLQVVEQTGDSAQTTSDGLNTYDSETMYIGGYSIKVFNPDYAADHAEIPSEDYDQVLSELGYIKIGEVTLTKTGISSWDTSFSPSGTMIPEQSSAQYAYFNGSMVGAPYLGYPDAITYPAIAGNYIDLYTHINATGSGEVNNRNPHGLSAADIGITVNNTTVHSTVIIPAESGTTYSLAEPLLDLNTAPGDYDTILIDATDAGAQHVTVRLPQANQNNISARYIIKRIDINSSATVSISTYVSGSDNLIDGIAPVSPNTDYSIYPLTVLGSTNSNYVTVTVGTVDGSNKYNWYII